jgi:hypothetical protein
MRYAKSDRQYVSVGFGLEFIGRAAESMHLCRSSRSANRDNERSNQINKRSQLPLIVFRQRIKIARVPMKAYLNHCKIGKSLLPSRYRKSKYLFSTPVLAQLENSIQC